MSLGYKEASIAGIKVHGRQWKHTIHGVKIHVEALNEIAEGDPTLDDVETIMGHKRAISKAFERYMATHLPEEAQHSSEIEAVEELREDTPTYEIENGSFEDFMENYRSHMTILYDMADFNRALIQ